MHLCLQVRLQPQQELGGWCQRGAAPLHPTKHWGRQQQCCACKKHYTQNTHTTVPSRLTAQQLCLCTLRVPQAHPAAEQTRYMLTTIIKRTSTVQDASQTNGTCVHVALKTAARG